MPLLARVVLILLLAINAALAAPDGEKQIGLIGEGRYEELANQYESLLQAPKASAADLHGLCYAYHKIKNYERLSLCLDRLEQRIQQGDKEGRLFGADDLTPYAAILRSESANELGDYMRAISEAGRALDWYDREREGTQVEIDSLAALVLALSRVGDQAAAREYVKRLEKVSTGGWFSNDFKTAKSLALARSYLALGAYEQAYKALSGDFLFEASALLDRLFSGAVLTGENLWLWQDLPRQYMLGKALLESGHTEEASRRLNALAASPHIRQNGEIYWQLLYDLGRLSKRAGDLAKAANYFQSAVEVIEQHRQHIDTEVNKIGFAADRQVVYADLVDALFRLGRYPEMLEYVERAKARALVDLLARKWRAAPPEKLEKTAVEQFSRISRLEEQSRRQMQSRNAPANDSSGAVKQARQALFQTDPMFASLIAIYGVDAGRIRQGLRSDETLLEYFARGDDLYVLVVDRDGVQAVKLDGDGLTGLVGNFRRAVAARAPDVEAMARRLYDRLLRPVEGTLRQRLTLVPHGPLHYLSFAALHDGHAWLMEKHSLRVLPSADVDALLRARPERAVGATLILANPDTGVAANDLQHADVEARGIAGLLPNARVLSRRAASETALRAQAGSASYIHLASHGKFRSAEPLKSFLLLAPDAANDGVLSVDDIYGLRLDADLVALSACDTGLGQGSPGDDLVGFVRGFFYSGARSLLASYWSVDDAATAELMQSFYANLGRLGKAEALRQAQREVAQTRPAPYYWAAFYLAGLGE
ncbi:MAG: CHAT domain-containing protein [Gallionellaceae bacterium]|nr:CHAT domain-containing protein [Gallionellaceae bacterium]